jgi:hypothetical protein
MRKTARGLGVVAIVVLTVGRVAVSQAVPLEDRSGARRAMATAAAVAANTLPVVPTYVEPRCLLPYVLCKLTFAILGVAGAGESLVMSGGSDMDQPRNLIRRGVGGDWFVTPRDMVGETKPTLLPDVAPSGGDNKPGGFVPPPK